LSQCELVISGWYASDAPRNYRTWGDEVIRGAAFRQLWWRSVDTFIKPNHVFVVDSASPVKPDDAAHTSTPFRHLELLKNPGHAQNCSTHYCGAMAAIILGLEYALHNDVDMVLYVEQDALVYGDRIVEKTKNALRRRDLVFGDGPRQIEQSYFGATRRGIRSFLSGLHAIRQSDQKIAPEHKFMYAGARYLPTLALGLAAYTPVEPIFKAKMRLFSLLCSLARGYEVLPFGYGRNRPINFNDEAFYFQQGTAAELAQYRALAGF
jgi:hypothetical protein